MASYEVLLVNRKLGHADYPRPAVVIATRADGNFTALPVTTKIENYRPEAHFMIRADDPDFTATGLAVDSIVLGMPVFDIAQAQVIKRLGALEGNLADRFRKWLSD